MKNCEYWQQQISRFLDGDLTPQEEEALWEHIADCPDCAQAFEEMSQQTSVLRAQMVRPPVDLSRLVMARIRAGQADEPPAPEKKPVSHRLRPRRKLAAAACFVGLVAAAAVTGIFSQNIRSSGGGDTASRPAIVQSETFNFQLPQDNASGPSEQDAAPSRDAGEPAAKAASSNAEDAPAAPEQQPAEQQTLPPPEAEQQTLPPPEEEQNEQAPDPSSALSAAEAAPDDAAVPEESADETETGGSGIMTVMEPPAAGDAGAQLPAGESADDGALSALLTGEPWQGEAAEPVYTLTVNGGQYEFAADENGALLWRQAGGEGWTLSPASLADLEALMPG